VFIFTRVRLRVLSSIAAMISALLGLASHAPSPVTTPMHPPAIATSAPAATPASVSASVLTKPAVTEAAAVVHRPTLGVYAGPAAKGVAGAAAFASFSGAAPGAVLDFAATDSWAGITGPSWLLSPRVGSAARLEYSLPMFPDGSQYSLAACASGAYNAHWKLTAQNLISHHLADTIVRPGWEFNGTWYGWSAKSDVAGYIGCFRQIVTTMRSVSGQRFAFDWNPSIGADAFPAELAYPGDQYVDYVGVDIYDTSWSHYPSASMASARAAAWNDALNGNHGLAFWSGFASSHHKPMALTEWGVTALANGHGGGDDPAFIDHIFDFMTDPANNVAYGHYFDWASGAGDHKLTGATHFPASAAQYRKRSQALMSER
jgi:Glycosyl hydrolase family 26